MIGFPPPRTRKRKIMLERTQVESEDHTINLSSPAQTLNPHLGNLAKRLEQRNHKRKRVYTEDGRAMGDARRGNDVLLHRTCKNQEGGNAAERGGRSRSTQCADHCRNSHGS